MVQSIIFSLQDLGKPAILGQFQPHLPIKAMPRPMEQQLNFLDLLKVRQQHFEGPLALLLELIRKHKLEIHSIQITEICNPYLEHLRLMKEFDLEVAVEFLDLASTLILIKSRRLLPREEVHEDDNELLDPEEALRRKLILYEAFQNIAADLVARPLLLRDRFPRPLQSKTQNDLEERQFDLSLYALIRSYKQASSREDFKKPHEISHETKSIEQKIIELLDILIPNEGTTFWELVKKESAKEEVILAFMAILELAKLKALTIQQVEQFSSVHLFANEKLIEYRQIFRQRGESLGLLEHLEETAAKA